MSNSLRRSLSGLTSAFPTALSPYWRALPIKRMKLFLAGTFLIAVAAGFCVDLLQLNFPRLGRGLFWLSWQAAPQPYFSLPQESSLRSRRLY